MFGTNMKQKVLSATAVSALLMAVAASPAYAVSNFTFDPANASGLSTNTTGNSQFSADKITIADYATIHIPADPTVAGSISESGVLAFTSFVNQVGTGAGFVNGTGTGIGIAGATPYQLYITFTSTSHLNPVAPGILQGKFDSVSYSLFGDVGGKCTFSASGAACGSDTQIALSTGVLSATGTNQAFILNGIPQANVQLTVNKVVPGFFASFASAISIQMEGAFTNTPQAVTSNCGPSGVNCTVNINGGGGNLDFIATRQVPEPGTLWLLGAGLLGLAGVGRRMRARS